MRTPAAAVTALVCVFTCGRIHWVMQSQGNHTQTPITLVKVCLNSLVLNSNFLVVVFS